MQRNGIGSKSVSPDKCQVIDDEAIPEMPGSYGSETKQSKEYDFMFMLGNIQKMSNRLNFDVKAAQERGDIPVIEKSNDEFEDFEPYGTQRNKERGISDFKTRKFLQDTIGVGAI